MAIEEPTEQLIDKLAADLKPVRPLPCPLHRAAVASTVVLLCVFGAIFAFTHGFRPDLRDKMGQAGYLSQNLSILLAGLMAAFATFRLSVPDTRIRPAVYALLAGATGIWLVHIAAMTLEGGWHNIEVSERNCLTDLALFMVVPIAAVTFMLTRSAPIWRGWAGYAAVLSIGSFGALGMRMICPNDAAGHLLVWHFMPVLVFAFAGIFLGQILLKFKVAKF